MYNILEEKNPIIYNYKINQDIVPRFSQVRDLGVILESKLSLSSHYQTIVTEALKLLGFVLRVSADFKDPFSLKTLCYSLVRPILEFASVVWCSHQITYIEKIEKNQKKSHLLCFIVFPGQTKFHVLLIMFGVYYLA